ncbi:uncharacterized protein LOC144469831 isoform X4 [Augochlora pura]
MDVFQKIYSIYYNVMYITGLLPNDYSLKTKVQRIGFCLLTLCCIWIQVSTLKMVEISLKNVLQTLSITFPLLLFFLRYVGFIITFPAIQSTFDNIERDYVGLRNPAEMDIFTKQILEAKRVVMVLVNRDSILVTYQLVIVIWMGLFSLSCTESSLAVIASYLCGLLEITSYRIRTAVDEMANSPTVSSDIIDIRSAMDSHQRATELSAYVTKTLAIPYLVAVTAVVISFAVNIYRLFLAFEDLSDKENILICIQITLIHFFIIYLNNYNGQKLITSSLGLFNDIYNSLWYCIPPKSQKMLLFVLMRSSYVMQFSCAGLFIPSNQGFAKMMSTSFSYFTTIMSV